MEVRVFSWAPFFCRSASVRQQESTPLSGNPTIHYHTGDLLEGFTISGIVVVDTETISHKLHRDRLCLVQLSAGDHTAHLVSIEPDDPPPENLKRVLCDPDIVKIFHFGRFDIASLLLNLNIRVTPVFCTKIASRLTRTNAASHGLRVLCREFLNVELNKEQQTSDWAARPLSEAQMAYAASDVLYLHALKEKLEARLARDGRREMAEACFSFLPDRAALDVAGWAHEDIFAHAP